MKTILKRSTALFISFCMMLSVFGAMLSVNASGSVSEAKKYVSLGDSMTNGYGLPGYDGDMGCYDYGHVSYANQLAAYYGFEHSPLAMSAMRVEDLHWLLEFDYTDAEAVAITDKDYNDGKWEEFGEAEWNAKFPTTGDYWTWNELCDDYRFAYAAAYIKAAQGDEAVIAELAKNARYKIRDKEAVIVAETYQTAIREADVVSFAMGNGNFGVFLLNRIMEAIGFMGTPDDTMIYKIDRAIAALPADMQADVKALIPTLYAAMENKLGVVIDDGDDNNTTVLEAIAHTAVYTCLSFVINYRGCIDAILTLNEKENVDIILLNLLNTYKDPADDTTAGISIGDLLEALYGPLNAYIAALPAVMQASGNPLYSNATFYYAAPEDISCMVNVYGYDFYENGYVALENRGNGGVTCTNSTTRDRFVTDIVGGGNGIVWGLLGGLGVVPVTLEEICAYDAMTYAQKTAYAAVNADKAKSCAVYLAFEAAIIEKASASAVLIESMMALGNLDGNLFNGVMGSLEGNIMNVIGNDQMMTVGAATGLANVANAGIAGAGLGLTGNVTFEDIITIYSASDKDAAAKAVAEKVANAEANSTAVNYMATQVPGYAEAAHDQFVRGVKAQIVEQLYGSLKTAAENMTTICTLLATPLALSNSIKDDATVISLMALFGRCNLGHGLGGHPSPAGHNAMFATVLEAYEGGHTAMDETIDNLFYLITEYSDEAYALVDSMALKNTDYNLTKNSSYVAFGDNKKLADSYAAYLSGEIQSKYGLTYSTNTAYAIDGSRITTLAGVIAADPSVIANADLISIGYSLNKTTEDTLNILFDLLANGESALLAAPMDWDSLFGPEVGVEIRNYLSGIKGMLDAQGMNVKIADMNSFFARFKDGMTISEAAQKAVEYFAYYAIEYIAVLPNVISAIRQINPDAIITVNAISNPAKDAGIVFGETSLMFGGYFDTLVDLVYMSTALVSVTNDNVVLVPATQAETTFTGKLLGGGTGFAGLLEILNYMLDNTQVSITSTEAGDAYTLGLMKNALNITIKRGDFTLDGKVTVADTVYLMQHLSNPAKYSMAQSGDVNGDGAVNKADVTYLLRYILSPARYPLA